MHLYFLTSMFKAATCVLERLLQVVLGGKLETEEIYTKGDQLTGCNNSTVETWLEADMERKDQTWKTVLWYYHFITSVQANVKFKKRWNLKIAHLTIKVSVDQKHYKHIMLRIPEILALLSYRSSY